MGKKRIQKESLNESYNPYIIQPFFMYIKKMEKFIKLYIYFIDKKFNLYKKKKTME